MTTARWKRLAGWLIPALVLAALGFVYWRWFGQSGDALLRFADLISQAGDIGLHIILARGAGGAGRAVFGDPLITRIKESANPGLIMSGSKDEGALWGDVKASAMPPGRGTLTTRSFKGAIQTAVYDAVAGNAAN